MSATDELRRLLDERGVKWCRTPHYSSESIDNETVFAGNGIEWYAHDHLNGRIGLRAARYEVTPEQAIEATLGPAVSPPEPPVVPYDVLIDLLRDEWDIDVMWDGLRRFWYVGLTDEGVRKRDEREATLGRCTCHAIVSDNLNESEGTGDAWANCSECGHLLCVLTDPSSQMPNFCPNCGRKVVDDASVD